MLHITFSKYDCITMHNAYYLFTCTCISINLFYSHSHSYSHIYHAIQTVSIRTKCRSMMGGSICLQLGMMLVRLHTCEEEVIFLCVIFVYNPNITYT